MSTSVFKALPGKLISKDTHLVFSISTSNSYTMVCQPGRGDNSLAEVSGISPSTGRQPWFNFYTISV